MEALLLAELSGVCQYSWGVVYVNHWLLARYIPNR